MTQQQIILFGLFALVFAALVWGRWRYDLIAFSALLAAVVLGVVPAEGAFEGFGHPATLVVALVLIVSAGLTRTGVVMAIARRLLTTDRALAGHIAIMGAVGGLLSAFMNNVAALALLMPVDMETARKAGRASGRKPSPSSASPRSARPHGRSSPSFPTTTGRASANSATTSTATSSSCSTFRHRCC